MKGRPTRGNGLLLYVAAAIFAWTIPGGAQEPNDPPVDLFFGEEIDVRVVNLEVVVEDRAGDRVPGLTADDFRIFVDGAEVDVEYFTEILENRAVESQDHEAPPAIGDGEVVPTNYLLFVDDDHTHVTFRRPVLRGFADQLASLGLADPVAIVVQSGRRLELLSPFTTDREETLRALRALEQGRLYGGVLRAPRFIAGEAPTGDRMETLLGAQAGVLEDASVAGELSGGLVAGQIGPRVDADLLSAAGDLPFPAMRLPELASEVQASELARDLEFSVIAVSSAMRTLDVPNGRKVLLLLAGGWPTGMFRPAGQSIGVRTDREILNDLIDTANVLGYTVYPVDQQTGPNMTRWGNLRHMARETGGRAYMAGTNLAALRRVSADVANYYWLGFVPEYRRDDLVHDVRVEVRGPGLRVRSRGGYADVSRQAEADMETQGRLLFPDQFRAPDAPALRVEVGKAEPTGIRKMLVPVTVYVPIGYFPVVPYQGEYLARLELRFAVVDRNGGQADIPLIPINLRGRNRPAPDAVMPYYATLTLRRRPHDLVVSVHDPLTRGTLSERVRVSFK